MTSIAIQIDLDRYSSQNRVHHHGQSANAALRSVTTVPLDALGIYSGLRGAALIGASSMYPAIVLVGLVASSIVVIHSMVSIQTFLESTSYPEYQHRMIEFDNRMLGGPLMEKTSKTVSGLIRFAQRPTLLRALRVTEKFDKFYEELEKEIFESTDRIDKLRLDPGARPYINEDHQTRIDKPGPGELRVGSGGRYDNPRETTPRDHDTGKMIA